MHRESKKAPDMLGAFKVGSFNHLEIKVPWTLRSYQNAQIRQGAERDHLSV
jgi:hypothetical protein